MSPRKQFDRFMVANDNGRNGKLARFTDAEFRAIVQGVWPIASEADPRGAFLIGKAPATADDIVFKAPKVSKRAATSALAKLRQLGMLEWDDQLGGEWVHDWDLLNPAPKNDRTNAKRQAEWRARNAARNAESNAVTEPPSNGEITPPEVRRLEEPQSQLLKANAGSGTNGDGPEAEPPGTPTGHLRVLSSPVGDRHGLPLDEIWKAS